MNPSVLPQVTVLLCLSVMVPVGIALVRAELLRACMHYAILAQHLIVGFALWVVVDGATAIVAAHFKISVNHSSLILKFLIKRREPTPVSPLTSYVLHLTSYLRPWAHQSPHTALLEAADGLLSDG